MFIGYNPSALPPNLLIATTTNAIISMIITAAKIAKKALKNNSTLREEALKSGLINKKDYEKIVDPKKMIYPA